MSVPMIALVLDVLLCLWIGSELCYRLIERKDRTFRLRSDD